MKVFALTTLIVLLGFAAESKARAIENNRPNIVIINADDLGYGDLGCYGATKVQTPNIDRIASEGRRFTDAHSASAVCSPSRYGLMTGQYPSRRNFWGPAGLREPLTIEADDVTIASLLKENGYRTACIGKWHLGFGMEEPDWNGELKPGPLEVGFDYYFGIPTVNSGPPFVYVENHKVVGLDPDDPFQYKVESATKKYPEKSGYKAIGGATKAHELYVDDQIATTLANKAVDWINKQERQQPFFLYLATTNIHHPFTPAKQFVGTSQCGPYGDFIHELDWVVGQVFDALEQSGQLQNTLLIITSDNGGMFNVTGQKAWEAGHRMNGELQGFKFGAWEGGHRVPFIARWPNKIPANTTSDHLISQVDLLETLAAILETDDRKYQTMDSVNQLETLVGNPAERLRRMMIVSPNSPKHLTIRIGDWVYIPAQGAGGFQGKKAGDHLFSDGAALPFVGRENSDYVDGKLRADAPSGQLYDLRTDPGQTTNLFLQNPANKVNELSAPLERYRQHIPPGKPIGWINLKQ